MSALAERDENAEHRREGVRCRRDLRDPVRDWRREREKNPPKRRQAGKPRFAFNTLTLRCQLLAKRCSLCQRASSFRRSFLVEGGAAKPLVMVEAMEATSRQVCIRYGGSSSEVDVHVSLRRALCSHGQRCSRRAFPPHQPIQADICRTPVLMAPKASPQDLF